MFVAQPLLQGAVARQQCIAGRVCQLQQQPPGTPLGMLFTKLQRTASELGKVLGLLHAASVVMRLKGLVAMNLHLTNYTTHRARGDIKLFRNQRRILAGNEAIPNCSRTDGGTARGMIDSFPRHQSVNETRLMLTR
jgi:hypothetical protein